MEVIEKHFRILVGELEKKGQMKGVIVELTSTILKKIKEVNELKT